MKGPRLKARPKTKAKRGSQNPDPRPDGPVQQLDDGRYVNCRHFIPGAKPLWLGPEPHVHDLTPD